jgi:hypothetical protein
MSGIDLRPLSLGELLDRTFFLYRRHVLLFAGIAAIPYFVALLAVVAAVVAFGIAIPFALPKPGHPMLTPAEVSTMAGGFAIGGVLIYCAFALSAGASAVAVAELYQGRKPSIWEALRRALSRIFSLLGVMILSIFITMAGFIFLIFPGIYLACRLSAGIAAAIIENVGPGRAISRSFHLTKSFAGRAFLIILLNAAVVYAAMFLVQLPLLVLVQVNHDRPALAMTFAVLAQVGNFISTVLVMPVLLVGFAVYYFDLRVRKEAFDLQVMMQSLGTDSFPPAVSGGEPGTIGSDAL